MNKLTSKDFRQMWFDYFKSTNHTILPSASLIPENDPTVLFTMAGMHPLVPYLLGETHPGGKRLTNIQKCIRTGDIDEVGDASHLTFFEMMGNWSLGDYTKEDAIKMSYEFLTDKKYLNIPKNKLYFTCFAGDEDFPKDEESFNAWVNQGVEPAHIFYLPKENNFWILASGIGPCGPDSEMFYDTGVDKCSPKCSPACSCGKYLEIWNDVFMEYNKDEKGNITKLKQANVDTGMGLERTLQVLNGLESVYDTELFTNVRKVLETLSNVKYEDNLNSFRIIMDHLRAATFILADEIGVTPSNTGGGYVLRRLIRRTIRHLKKIKVNDFVLADIAKVIIADYKHIYPELETNQDFVFKELKKEEEKFNTTLLSGEKWFYRVIKNLKGNIISGSDAFKLFDTFGFPLEFTEELAKENNLIVDIEGFNDAFKLHQEKSKTLEAGSFKGGLADESYETTKYHTLAHIMLACLQKMYGKDTIQKGSNITSERIRFDFNLAHKMEEQEKEELEGMVNKYIQEGIPVVKEEMSFAEAKKAGAHGTFENKYGSVVKVYTIGDVSKEICGGPHVNNTNELGTFKIIKEESSSSGVRRIKAVLN